MVFLYWKQSQIFKPKSHSVSNNCNLSNQFTHEDTNTLRVFLSRFYMYSKCTTTLKCAQISKLQPSRKLHVVPIKPYDTPFHL